jgi:hypothetical protein
MAIKWNKGDVIRQFQAALAAGDTAAAEPPAASGPPAPHKPPEISQAEAAAGEA